MRNIVWTRKLQVDGTQKHIKINLGLFGVDLFLMPVRAYICTMKQHTYFDGFVRAARN